MHQEKNGPLMDAPRAWRCPLRRMQDGSVRRTVDPDRHRRTKAEKKRHKRARRRD